MNFRCPVCLQILTKSNQSYRCENNHCFDCAKSGYVNLNSGKNSTKIHGDNKLMVQARTAYLEKGYYSALIDSLINLLSDYSFTAVADCGCGEGYYTRQIKYHFINSTVFGFDLSKDAVLNASRHDKESTYAISSIFNLPLFDESVDLVTNIFAPIANDEFQRILKRKGLLLTVTPGPRHLFQLKELIYRTPYLNDVSFLSDERFQLLKSQLCQSQITLNSAEDIHNLFVMTPYYYKTSIEDKKKLDSLTQLTTEIEFSIQLYTKR